MSKVEILQMGPYASWDEEPLNAKFTMHRYFEAADKAALLRDTGPAIRGIATRGELGADRALIDALPNLEIISIYGVGYDAVDLDAAGSRRIRVTNTPDVLTRDVADLGVAMLLALARGVIGADAWVRSGDWRERGPFPLQSRVHGRRAGVLGLGAIGYQVARRLAAFDLDIGYTSRQPKEHAADWRYYEDPVSLAQNSDFLFVTLAASAETRHIVDAAVLRALGSEGVLINISRASNVDEEALLNALETGALGAAALDVFENEPAVDARFLALDNVLLQPHQASATVETRKAMGKLVYDNLVAHFDGREPPTPVI